jgi:hypothetical protein
MYGLYAVMAGLGPAIHAFSTNRKKGVGGRTKCGHDALSAKVAFCGSTGRLFFD